MSDGRFVLGLGASGPQVVEGFHGVAFDRPMPRDPRLHRGVPHGVAARAGGVRRRDRAHPVAAGRGHGARQGAEADQPPEAVGHPDLLGQPHGQERARRRPATPTGWLPVLFDPAKFGDVWGDDIAAGLARRDPTLGPLQISAGGLVAIGDQYTGDGADAVLDLARPQMALYVGGMGARDKNFYNTICQRYGYVEAAATVQDLYLAGRRQEAAAAVPRALLAGCNLVGSAGEVGERIAAYREAGVTHLQVVPATPDPVAHDRAAAPTAGLRTVSSPSDHAAEPPQRQRPAGGEQGGGGGGPLPRVLDHPLDRLAERGAEHALDALVDVGELGLGRRLVGLPTGRRGDLGQCVGLHGYRDRLAGRRVDDRRRRACRRRS